MSSSRESASSTSPGHHDEPGRLDAAVPSAGVPFDTTEVRWFVSGSLPASYVDWFSSAGETAVVEVRCDTYWVDGLHSTGLKRRGRGPLEVKLRRDSTGSLELGSGIRGRIEEWRKIHPAEQRFARPGRSGEWCEVNKVVRTRTFGLRSTGSVDPLSSRDLTSPGCDVQLASVDVAGSEAWTFALEAWGPADERRSILDGAAAALLQSSPFPKDFLACLDQDMGYPEWLALVMANRSQPGS